MLELVERATSASVFRSSGSNVRRDFAGRLTHARFRVRMKDDTGRSEREPAGRAEAMILRRHRHRAASVQFHLLEQAGVLRPDGVAETEVHHFGNCPVCGAYVDMRDLGAVLDHKGAACANVSLKNQTTAGQQAKSKRSQETRERIILR